MHRRVLVGGGRVAVDSRLAYAVLDRLHRLWDPDLVIIEGDAVGYDRIAGAWARRRRLIDVKVPIDPELDGWKDDAPKRRNQRAIDQGKPDAAVAFPGGPGTRDMIERCMRQGIPVYDVDAQDGMYEVWCGRQLIATGRYLN